MVKLVIVDDLVILLVRMLDEDWVFIDSILIEMFNCSEVFVCIRDYFCSR